MLAEGCKVDTPFAWLVAFAAFVCYSVSIGCYVGTTGILYSVFLEEFEVDRGATALMSALTSMVFLGCGVVAGYMTNRWGCRLVVLLGSTCMGLAFVISSFSTSMTLIYLTQGLFKGFATILIQQPLFVVVADYHVKRLALAMSFVASGSGVGSAIFASLSQFLIDSLGWRWGLRVLGCIFFTLVSLSALAFYPIDRSKCSSPSKRSTPLKLGELFKIPAFRYFCISVFFLGGFLTAYTTFLSEFAESRNISPTDAATLWTWWGISTVAGRLSGGILESSWKTRIRDFSFSILGLGICSWILAFRSENYPNFIAFVISQVCNGWLMGMLYHLSSLCLGDVLGVENVSLGIGLFYTAQMPLGVAAPPVLGFVADQADGNWTVSFQIMAVVQTVSGLLIYFFWKHGRQEIRKRTTLRSISPMDEFFIICIGRESFGFFKCERMDYWANRKLKSIRSTESGGVEMQQSSIIKRKTPARNSVPLPPHTIKKVSPRSGALTP